VTPNHGADGASRAATKALIVLLLFLGIVWLVADGAAYEYELHPDQSDVWHFRDPLPVYPAPGFPKSGSAVADALGVAPGAELKGWRLLPPRPIGHGEVDPRSLGIDLCGSRSACRRAASRFTRFVLAYVLQHDRRTGNRDSFDFIFCAAGSTTRCHSGDPLRFVYRWSTDNQRSSGLIASATGNGFEVKDNVVARLAGFDDSPLAGYLATRANRTGLSWGNVIGAPQTRVVSDLGDYLRGKPLKSQVVGPVARWVKSKQGAKVIGALNGSSALTALLTVFGLTGALVSIMKFVRWIMRLRW